MKDELNIDDSGWLNDVEIIQSSNFNERPEDCSDARLIVVHGISLPPGQYGGGYVQQLFTNQLDPGEHEYFDKIKGLQVSAHCFITREGKVIQFVSFKNRAWHAGISSWQGTDNCNDFSIGIEMEGTDDEAYEDKQYQQLAKLVISLRKQYPAILEQSLCGHSDISPGRKTDPGPFFDWNKLSNLINKNN